MSNTPVRWGILGTGWIADRFVEDLRRLEGHQAVAVGSRGEASAQAFAGKHGIARSHGSYEALAADAGVDVVYIATPHPLHHPNARLVLEAGKPVLLEKPFTMDAAQAADLAALARSKGLFLMEAMWTRFLPHIRRVSEILKSGSLGEIVTVQADHGQWFAKNAEHRLFAPRLGGGALLDLGIYPVSFAALVLGQPSRVIAVSNPAFTGVDAQTSILLQHPGGAHAVLNTTLTAASPNRAAIVGTEARIEIDRTYYCPSGFTMTHRDGQVLERWEKPYEGHGLREQAAEVGRCLAAGLKESPLMPLDETVAIMGTLDEVRRQIGLVYPG
jgi:predicted dehydrogenase